MNGNGIAVFGDYHARRCRTSRRSVTPRPAAEDDLGHHAHVAAQRRARAIHHAATSSTSSLGSAAPCTALELAVRYATSHGALVIAAAGNEGSTSRFYPAAFPDVLSVAATTNRDQLAGFSNRGARWVDVAAPGDGIISTLPTYTTAPVRSATAT